MLSFKLTDGVLSILLLKLDKLDINVSSMSQAVSRVNTLMTRQQSVDRPTASTASLEANLHQLKTASGASARPIAMPGAQGPGTSAQPDFTPRSNYLDTDSSRRQTEDTSDTDGYETVRRKKRKKSLSPEIVPGVSYADKLNTSIKRPTAGAKKTMIGNSTNSSIKASKTLFITKSVLCSRNIDCNYSVDDISDYIKSIGVRLLTCFELRPTNMKPSDNKSFRICIVAEDKLRLLDSSLWSVGVTIKDWVRKAPTAAGDARESSSEQARSSTCEGQGQDNVTIIACSSDPTHHELAADQLVVNSIVVSDMEGVVQQQS